MLISIILITIVGMYFKIKVININNIIKNSYHEWLRDWPDEAQQPVHLYKVLIPATIIS